MTTKEGPIIQSIRKKLEKTFKPISLDIINDSALHAGHSGANNSGESHLRIHMICTAFRNLSQVQRQRLVYKRITEELEGELHAISFKLKSPDELS